MEFPDFLKFKPFNYLRELMGANELGDFEFFDPSIHLSADDRRQLLNGLMIPFASLVQLQDKTLSYKNGRVLVSVPEPKHSSEWCYHPAACGRFEALSGLVRASTLRPQNPLGQYTVCAECLQVLRYKGFDAVRNRHRHYSQRVQDEFDLEEFFAGFPAYPLRAERGGPNLLV